MTRQDRRQYFTVALNHGGPDELATAFWEVINTPQRGDHVANVKEAFKEALFAYGKQLTDNLGITAPDDTTAPDPIIAQEEPRYRLPLRITAPGHLLYDVAELNSKDLGNFMDYYQRHKGIPPQELVQAWNAHATSIRQHVFLTASPPASSVDDDLAAKP